MQAEVHPGAVLAAPDDMFGVMKTPSVLLQEAGGEVQAMIERHCSEHCFGGKYSTLLRFMEELSPGGGEAFCRVE